MAASNQNAYSSYQYNSVLLMKPNSLTGSFFPVKQEMKMGFYLVEKK